MKDVVTKEEGRTYTVPTYGIDNDGVVDKEPFDVKFCKGAKDDESIPRQDGFFTESLLTACRHYLTDVNKGPVANDLTRKAIIRIDEAIQLLRRRAKIRQAAGVQNTMKPAPDSPAELAKAGQEEAGSDLGDPVADVQNTPEVPTANGGTAKPKPTIADSDDGF